MVNADELREVIASGHEWLLISELGRTFPFVKNEIEITCDRGRVLLGFLDDRGFHSWRVRGFTRVDDEIVIETSGAFGAKSETIRLVPRTPAADMTAEIRLARLQRANEIAGLIADSFPGTRMGRIVLNIDGGRLAEINFDTVDNTATAAVADVTGALTVEALFTSAMLWLEKLGLRKKKPVLDIWIICEKRQAKNAQKLHALLSGKWASKISVFEIVRKGGEPFLAAMPKRKISEIWREKAPRLTLPETHGLSKAAREIMELSPKRVDVIVSRQGETLRYMGLPIARVRTVMKQEKAWFGVDRDRRILSGENRGDLAGLLAELETYRSPEPPNKRHRYFRSSPEAWLESILRRNIKLLDANLILSPIYNQFRSSSDKIDLLALRRDGRLVIIELKTQPDRDMIFQAADYWRKIELQRRRGILAAADLFAGREILDKPAIIYLAAPAWSFHRDFEFFARSLSPEIELWRFELHEKWREKVKVVARNNYNE